VTNPAADTEPRVRRGYFECRFGQLHLRNAIPPGGGFDEGTPLICLHPFPLSSRVFEPLLPVLGRERSVYAPDLPGYGESDAPPTSAAIADYAAAVADFCDSMRLRQVDLIGYHSGSLVAVELAIAKPAIVRRVALIGVPVATDAERDSFRAAPWPVPPTENGSYLLAEWQRSLGGRSGRSLAVVARNFADKLHNGPNAWLGLSAALQYPVRERLNLMTQSVLLLRPQDELAEATARARALLPRARLMELSGVGAELLDAAPAALTDALREFLRG
jgi:pimeloyl-ACP methyl ester carboxylesterase